MALIMTTRAYKKAEINQIDNQTGYFGDIDPLFRGY
jgi:hypothetical protein